MIEIFDLLTFEQALPVHKETHVPLCSYFGLVKGEHVYVMHLDGQVHIDIRSSIHADGNSAGAGKDSIRLTLMYGDIPMGGKNHSYINRTKGWQGRLTAELRLLYKLRLKAGNCKKCGLPKFVWKSRQPQSKGKWFAKCHLQGCWPNEQFTWLEV